MAPGFLIFQGIVFLILGFTFLKSINRRTLNQLTDPTTKWSFTAVIIFIWGLVFLCGIIFIIMGLVDLQRGENAWTM